MARSATASRLPPTRRWATTRSSLSFLVKSADNYYPSTGTVSFGVAEYRAPEFQVTVTAQTPEVVQGDTIKVTVDSKYFFGGSVANADVQYNVTAQPYGFNYTGNGYYSFEDVNADGRPGANLNSGPNGIVTSGEGKTDANGLLTISIPADLQDATQSQTFTIEATVTDQSDQAVSGRTSVIVHKGLAYVGVQPEEYVAQAGSETKVDLIAVDWESQPIAEPVAGCDGGRAALVERAGEGRRRTHDLDVSGRRISR